MSQAKSPDVTHGIEAENGKTYPPEVYHETSRATGTQQWVADQWADGALPTHSTAGDSVKLYVSGGNFSGYQRTDGSGKLKHYRHLQAIRTRAGLVIGDSSCWSKGWAHCSYPRDQDGCIDLTTLKANLKNEEESIYDIARLDGDEVEFESGRIMSLEDYEWVKATPSSIDNEVLGL